MLLVPPARLRPGRPRIRVPRPILLTLAVISLADASPADAQERALVFHRQAGVAHGGFSRGVAWGDADGDGDPDLFVANSDSQRSLFYRNDAGRLVRVEPSPLTEPVASAEAASWVDYDDDGDLDLFVATHNRQPDQLFRNDGHLRFTRIADHPLVVDGASTVGACWADFTGDGRLDVLVVARNGERSTLFAGSGGGAFARVDGAAPAAGPGQGRACVAADLDGDGRVDLAVAHAEEPNALYRNTGAGFERVAGPFSAGARYSYGLSAADHDEDGDLDLFVANIDGPNQLFRNDGAFRFAEVHLPPLTTDTAGATKGHAWGDLDLDGRLDLYAANGTPKPAMHNWLYLGLGGGRYARAEGGPATADADTSAGAALADVDGDGRLDVFVASWGEGKEDNVLYRNATPPRGAWAAFDLRQPAPNVFALGARVDLVACQGGRARRQARWVLSSTGYGSQSDLRVHFGLGGARRVERVAVRWPDGARESFGPFAAGRVYRLARGEGRAGDGGEAACGRTGR